MIQAISDSPINEVQYATEYPEEFIYKSLSRAAMLSLVFGLFGFLAWITVLLVFLPAIGLVFGIVALNNLKKTQMS